MWLETLPETYPEPLVRCFHVSLSDAFAATLKEAGHICTTRSESVRKWGTPKFDG